MLAARALLFWQIEPKFNIYQVTAGAWTGSVGGGVAACHQGVLLVSGVHGWWPGLADGAAAGGAVRLTESLQKVGRSPRVDDTLRVPLQLSEELAAEDDEGEDGVPSFRDWLLPCREFHGMWEALCFDSDVKGRLLSYAQSALLFSQLGVDAQMINWNRWARRRAAVAAARSITCPPWPRTDMLSSACATL